MSDYMKSVLSEYGLNAKEEGEKDPAADYRNSVLKEYGLKEFEPEKRTIFGAANDYVIEFANAAAALPKAALDLASPGSKASAAIGEFIKEGEEKQSDVVKAAKAKLSKSMQSDSTLEEIKGAGQFVAENPLLSASMAAGSFVGPGFAVKGGKALGGALGFGTKGTSAAGTVAGSVTGGVLAGGDAAGSAYEMVMNSPSLQDVPLEEREQMATEAARKASIAPGLIGLVAGATGAEAALAKGISKGVLKTAGKEFATEAFEEGSTALSANVAASEFAPEIKQFQGVAGAATLGGLLGGATGAAVGFATRNRSGSILPDVNNVGTETGTESNAINSAIDSQTTAPTLNVSEIPKTPVEQAQQVAQAAADQQAQDDAAIAAEQQKQQQINEVRQSVFQKYGGVVQPLGQKSAFNFQGKIYYTQNQLNQALDKLVEAETQKPEIQLTVENAYAAANKLVGGKLLTPTALQKAVMPYVDQAESMEEIIARVELDLQQALQSVKSPQQLAKVEPIHALRDELAGIPMEQRVPTVDLLPKVEPKGKQDERLQLQQQGDAGLRTVSEQGGTTQTVSGQPRRVRPSGVQPKQPGSVAEGQTSQQAGQPTTGGVRTGTVDSTTTKRSVSDAKKQAPQIKLEQDDFLFGLKKANRQNRVSNLINTIVGKAVAAGTRYSDVKKQIIKIANANLSGAGFKKLDTFLKANTKKDTEKGKTARLSDEGRAELANTILEERFKKSKDKARDIEIAKAYLKDRTDKNVEAIAKQYKIKPVTVRKIGNFESIMETADALDINRDDVERLFGVRGAEAFTDTAESAEEIEKEVTALEEGATEDTTPVLSDEEVFGNEEKGQKAGFATLSEGSKGTANVFDFEKASYKDRVEKLKEGKLDKDALSALYEQAMGKNDQPTMDAITERLTSLAQETSKKVKRRNVKKEMEAEAVAEEGGQAKTPVEKAEALWNKYAEQHGLGLFEDQTSVVQGYVVDLVYEKKANLAGLNNLIQENDLVSATSGPKFSRKAEQKRDTWSASSLKDTLKTLFVAGPGFDKVVSIVDTFDQLDESVKAVVKESPTIQAFVYGERVYMIAENIDVGTETAIMLHEVGTHLGMEKLLGVENYRRLTAQVVDWSNAKTDKLETIIAKKAQQRVDRAAEIAKKEGTPLTANEKLDELLAYFVEEAVLAGINPQASINNNAIVAFLRQVVAAMKVALRKFGFNRLDSLTASNLVDLAYGAAKLEFDGTYHGTPIEFKKFLDEKVTTFINGWGHYTTKSKEQAGLFGKNVMSVLSLVDQKLLLKNNEPLRDQKEVIELLGKNLPASMKKAVEEELGIKLEAMDGTMFQEALGRIELNTGKLNNALPTGLKDELVDIREIVSKYMDTVLGIPGIYYTLTKDLPPHVIMFDGDSVARMATNVDGVVKFSRRTSGNIQKLPKQLQGPIAEITATIGDLARRGVTYLAFTEDLANIASKYLKSAKDYVALVREQQAVKTKYERRVDLVLQQYDKLPANLRGTGEGSVNKLLKDSTMAGKWAFQPDYMLKKVDVDPALEARFNSMPASAQAVIKSVFKHGFDTLQDMKKGVMDNITSEYDALIKAARDSNDIAELALLQKKKEKQLKDYTTLMAIQAGKPYAPLKRFGNFVVVAKSKDYLAQEAIIKNDKATEDEKKEARAKLRELEKSEKHYYVSFAETKREGRKIEEELLTEGYGYVSEAFEKDSTKIDVYGGRDVQNVFYRLRNLANDSLDENTGAKSTKAINRLINDLHLTLLAEQSARQSERRRKGIAGAEDDMMRSFATQGMATAHFIATLHNSGKIYDTLQQMQRDADAQTPGRDVRREYYNEFMKRHALGLDYEPNTILNKALGTTSFWMLLTNPAYYLQNMTQPFMLSLPSVAGKHGYDKSWVEFSRAYKEIFQMINKDGLSEESYAKLPADVREAIETLVNSGRIDISLDQDLGRWRDNEGSKTELAGKAIEKLRKVAQDIESVNRVATAVAAYRLEKASGSDTDTSIAYANQIILDTHGDYSGFNAPRITRKGMGRLATQFRKFQLIQISLMAKLLKSSFAGASKEEKMVARRALGFTLSHTLAAGGVMGFPGFAAIAWVMGAVFGDDDEPDNPELTLRKMIGNKELSDVILKGAPKYFGVDLSGKLGMGQMLSVLPYTDVDLSKAGIAQAGYALMTGPAGSLVQRAGEGLSLMADGEYYKGTEKFMPGVLAQSMKAARFGLMDGITLKNGDVVMKPEEISFLDMLSVAIGLPSNKITDRQFIQGVSIETDRFYKDRTGEIKRDYVKAVNAKDSAGMAKARQEWIELQEVKAKQKLARQPLSDLMKAPQEQKKRERNVEAGVPVTKSNKQYIKEISKL